MVWFGCLERPVARMFYWYGSFVARHPFPFIAFPLLITMYLVTGFLYMDPETDALYLYTPTNAPSKTERQLIHDHWPLTEDTYTPGRAVTQTREAQVSVVARDGANILLPQYATAIRRLDMYLQNRVKVKFRNREYGYKDLCLTWKNKGCTGNNHVQIISELYNHGINISYPMFRLGSRSGYLAAGVGGVSLSHDAKGDTILASARAWLLLYQLRFYPNNVSYVSGMWEKAFKDHLDNYPPDPYISITYFHSQTLTEELKRNASSLAPRFVFAFLILVIFAVFCSMVMIEGVFNAGMGIASAIGGLTMLGVRYNDIVAVMPFLVVAVGTDNMFLMVASVKRTSRAAPLQQRIGECMSDAAVSILITALTDAFSFGVGTITTIPAVQIFCVYTCCALVLTFVYQVTFFCALLSLATKWEGEGKHCLFLRTTVPPKMHNCTSLVSRVLWMGSRPHSDPTHDDNHKHCPATSFFQNWYAPLLMQPMIKALALVWYFIYVFFAVYGCTQLREGLEPINLLVDDSYAIPHYRVLEKYFWHYGATVQIVVNEAPDLRDALNRQKVTKMIEAFANTKHSIGNTSIQFWMKEMERYYRMDVNVSIDNEAFYQMASHFLYSHDDDPWMNDVVWSSEANGTTVITAFRFLVGMRDISSTTQQQAACATFRSVADEYKEYNVTTFMPLWLFTDQYALVVPNTVQDIVVAVLCMLLIAFVLIPQPFCALWVAFTIGSIDLGVLGYMTLWGVNLDAISMITIIMSVGFSVDYSAHITYGYVISKEKDPRMRVRDALGDLGWPVVQGAASTILAVIVLADVPAYMIMTFFKTVFLAITIGLVHGLIFLPLLLSIFVRGCCHLDEHHDEPEVEFIPEKKSVNIHGTDNLSFKPPVFVAPNPSPKVPRKKTFGPSFVDGFEMPMETPPPPSFPPPPLPRTSTQPKISMKPSHPSISTQNSLRDFQESRRKRTLNLPPLPPKPPTVSSNILRSVNLQ